MEPPAPALVPGSWLLSPVSPSQSPDQRDLCWPQRLPPSAGIFTSQILATLRLSDLFQWWFFPYLFMVKRWSVASVSILAANRNPHFGFTMKFGKPWVTAWGELGAMSSVIPVRMEAVRVLQWAMQSHPPAVFLTDRCTRPRILRTLLNMALGLLLKFNPLPNPLWGFGQRSEVSQSFCLNTCQLQAKGGTAFAWMNSVALFFFSWNHGFPAKFRPTSRLEQFVSPPPVLRNEKDNAHDWRGGQGNYANILKAAEFEHLKEKCDINDYFLKRHV